MPAAAANATTTSAQLPSAPTSRAASSAIAVLDNDVVTTSVMTKSGGNENASVSTARLLPMTAASRIALTQAQHS